MDTCSNQFCLNSPWQATCPGLLMNFRNAVRASQDISVMTHQQSAKTLTSGAVCMICVILFIILLAIWGSVITICELLRDDYTRKKKSDGGFASITRKNWRYDLWKKLKSSTDKAEFRNYKSFLGCFCILKNGRKILSTASNKQQFECIHGIRSLSSCCIILLHVCMGFMFTISNVEALKPLTEMWTSQLVLNGQYVVDSFFVLSGFLNAYLFFNKYDESKGNILWYFFYLKRFLRLTPVYMIVLGFHTFLFSYTGSGRLWPSFDTNPVCGETWWRNLLYINNFNGYLEQCMVWCWHLAADMQFYIISPIFLILLLRKPRIGYVLIGICIVASCFSSFMITLQNSLVDGFSRIEYHFHDMQQFFDQYWTYFDLVYEKPYTRINAYLIAILLAHYLHKQKNKKHKINKITLCFGWTLSAILWWIAYFALFKREESIIENAVYNAVKHPFYCIGLSWIIFVCLTGQGGVVNRFLSCKVFHPLARLSYCAYLTHPLVLMRYYQTSEKLEDFSIPSLLLPTVYIYFWTFVFSFITTLLFELPVLNLCDLVSGRCGGKVEHEKSR